MVVTKTLFDIGIFRVAWAGEGFPKKGIYIWNKYGKFCIKLHL